MDAQIYQFRKPTVIAINPWVDGIAVMQGATQFMAITPVRCWRSMWLW